MWLSFFSFLVKCWKWTFIFNCEPGGPGRFKKRFSPGAPFPVLCQVKSLLIFLSSAKRVNNRESNIARGWSYSQQSNLYLKKAALYSLENPRILWSCQPLISKGSLADRDLDLSYGARELWFWHQICRYIEDITWPRGDMNFIFECWKYLSWVREANEWEILSARYWWNSYIKHNLKLIWGCICGEESVDTKSYPVCELSLNQ